MKIICDKCGEEFESGLFNVLAHQFENCKAHTIEKIETDFGNFSIKTMPYINPIIKQGNEDFTDSPNFQKK